MKIFKELQVLGYVTLTATLAWGCSEPGPSEPDLPGGPALARVTPVVADAGEVLPFQLSSVATLRGQDLAPDFGPPLFGTSTFDGRCSVSSDFVIRFGFRGQAVHLGEVEGAVEHCTQVDFQTGTAEVTDGVLTLTAGNGDVLLATYVGGPGPDGLLEEHVTFEGGSGRFAQASGHATAYPRCDRATGTCDFTMSGVIAYDASNRTQ